MQAAGRNFSMKQNPRSGVMVLRRNDAGTVFNFRLVSRRAIPYKLPARNLCKKESGGAAGAFSRSARQSVSMSFEPRARRFRVRCFHALPERDRRIKSAINENGGDVMKACIVILGILLVAGIAVAADIDGKWEGELDMGGQKIPVSYTFKAEGAVLTGSTPIMDQEYKIQDGKINGNNISFSITMNMGQEMKVDYKGVLSGGNLTLSFDMMGQTTEIKLKKAK
jgi:hypothetical protein